ncbi:hexokinase-domain-containing protein [Obelidium mucronatum]|nr:hexokinase-domain-containing protein [Obelidium mucronatum]
MASVFEMSPSELHKFLYGFGVGVTLTFLTSSLLLAAPLSKAQKTKTKKTKTKTKTAAPIAQSLLDASQADDAKPETVARLRSMFALPVERLQHIVKQILADMKSGLESDGGPIKMLPSHVTRRPSGKEQGSFLALDLGGTNFRVCETTFDGKGNAQNRQSKFTISEAARTGDGNTLFDFIATCVKSFLKEHYYPDSADVDPKRVWNLGFTFSFPVDQTSINSGSLIIWTKGFTASGVVGKDCVELLKAAFVRNNLNINVTALVNDTTGTLVSLAYTQPDTHVGVILGTGSNCAYVEDISNIHKFKGNRTGIKEMLINMEWGGFDDNQVTIPRTKYDLKLDRQTARPGSYTFEQLISGMYLGEIVRLVLVDLVKTGEIFAFSPGGSPILQTKDKFETQYMSRIERDYSFDLLDVKQILEELLEIPGTTLGDRKLVKSIVEMVGLRSARLAAAGVAAVVTKINKLGSIGCTVGIDGSLFEKYPHYPNRMRDALGEILGTLSAENIKLERAQDGSGQGAALIACLAQAA